MHGRGEDNMKSFSNDIATSSEVTKNQTKITVIVAVTAFVTIVNTAMLLAIIGLLSR